MIASKLQWAGLGAALLFAGSALAQAQAQKVDLGKREYMNSCAVCHGSSGQGNGPYNGYLKKPATDLTTLAKRNNGIFPLARVYEVIEGGDAAHGSREMPVWGYTYRVEAAEYYMDVPYNPEPIVRARVLALAEYLNRLQAK